MNIDKNKICLIPIGMLIFTVVPAFGEVLDLRTDSNSYAIGDSIKFQGSVEYGDSGLVTIVVRDSNNEFVLLAQSIPDENYKFEKTIQINDKFTNYGMYNATGFIVNMTAGTTTEFEISDSYLQTAQSEPIKIPQENIINKTEHAPLSIEPKIQTSETSFSKLSKPDFVDPQKDPKYYVDRYYNEPKYKSWFDRNYPEYTIEEAVGYQNQTDTTKNTMEKLIQKEIIPEAQATSIVEPSKQTENNSETAQIVLAVGGLGILFGAVYGVKKKVDNNSKQISINKDTIRKKVINPLLGSNPLDILQTRLAKGEITLEEYDALERKLNKKR